MWTRFLQTIGLTDDANAPLDAEVLQPGSKVRRSGEETEGVLSGWLRLEEGLFARVVFQGYRSSWVDVIPVSQLVPA